MQQPSATTEPALLHRDAAPALTDRDRQVLRQLAGGRSTAQIAAAMSLTGNTVRSRIRRVQRKLSVPRRDAVVQRACDLRIL